MPFLKAFRSEKPTGGPLAEKTVEMENLVFAAAIKNIGKLMPVFEE